MRNDQNVGFNESRKGAKGSSINDESKQAKAEEKQGKRRKKAIMIIIDEEDQSSIMLASMLRNLLLSRLRTLPTH